MAHAVDGMTEHERKLLGVRALPPADCLARLGARERGLTDDEAQERLNQVGPNEVGQ
jgi:hypothetical protein